MILIIMEREKMYDIIIIGAGPAGLNAALYALRSGKSVLILESNNVGGQIANSPKLENFPTYMNISGLDFAIKFSEQVEAWGGVIEYETATKIEKDYSTNIFTVTTDLNSYECYAVIAALGVTHKPLKVPGEEELLGKGVHYCAVCDGAIYEGKEVAVIGDGNSAMQYANLLSNICSKVYLLTWFDKFFGEIAHEKAVRSNPKIIHMPYTSIQSFNGSEYLNSITYKDMTPRKHLLLELPVSAAFVAIGQEANNDILEKLVMLNEHRFVIPKNETLATKTAGLFVAGDCTNKGIKQVATAIADGAVAAMSACDYLAHIKCESSDNGGSN